MSIETVAVTGGNGRIGEAILADLADEGYQVVNVARGKRREEVSHQYLRTDLLDAGNVYGSLAESDADAVIHMGTIPAPYSNPGYEVYESNVMSTYHVLEAATGLDLEAACIASSINAMGSSYQEAPMEVDYLPVDESHRLTPRDPYATGKHALEVTCDGFGRQETDPVTISSLRYPWVAREDELRERFADADRSLDAVGEDTTGGRNELFAYIHISDAAEIARKAIEADFEGHERFWAVAADTSVDAPTREVAERSYPEAESRKSFSGRETLASIDKARDLLDWEPEYSWTDL